MIGSSISDIPPNDLPSFDHFNQIITPPCHHELSIPENSHHDNILSPQSSSLYLPSWSGSLWSCSPARTPSDSSHIYHCISTIRRDGIIYSITVSKGVVFTGSNSPYIRVLQPQDGCDRGYIQASSGKVRAMLAHGEMLFTSHKDYKVRVWRIIFCSAKFRPRKIITIPKADPLKFITTRTNFALQHKDTISCMAYYNAEGILYTGSCDKMVKVWRLSDGKCLDSFAAHADKVNNMVINQDLGFLFTCSSDGTLKMWGRIYEETLHTLITTLSFDSFPIYALALSSALFSKGSFLYSGSSDGCRNFWEQQVSGEYIHGGCIQAHQFAVLCFAVLDNLIISGSTDLTIKVWKREEGKLYHACLAVLEGHKGPVKCLAASLDKENISMGFLVFSGSSDRTFKLWRVTNFPEMKINDLYCGGDEDDANDRNYEDFEISSNPVLSPSWVEKKLRSSCSVTLVNHKF